MVMFAGAALACLLPPSGAGCVRTVAYPLSWLQSAVGGGSRALRRTLEARELGRKSPSEVADLERRASALERQVQHQSAEIADLKNQVNQLTGLRSVVGDERPTSWRCDLPRYPVSPPTFRHHRTGRTYSIFARIPREFALLCPPR